jgi:transcriptional regulator with XRE-family HTH domain
MFDQVQFGKKITNYRGAKKISQTELAKLLGITPQAVSR